MPEADMRSCEVPLYLQNECLAYGKKSRTNWSHANGHYIGIIPFMEGFQLLLISFNYSAPLFVCVRAVVGVL